MGIKDFTKLIQKLAPDAIENKQYSEFAGETWAIDASIFFYKFSYNPESKKPNSHIDGFYRLIYRLYKHGIRPILILDGETPSEKLHTLKKRKQQRQKNIDKIHNLQDELISLKGAIGESHELSHGEPHNLSHGETLENQLKAKVNEINQAKKNVIHFKPNVEQDICTLCDLFDVPLLRANGEADALCAKLYLEGKVQGIMSEDSDILLYNGGRLIRKFNHSNDVELIDLNRLLQKLKINYDQFIDLCILCGTDYTVEKIKHMGPIGAYEFIQSGLNIEHIVANIQISKTSTNNLKTFQKYDLPVDLNDFNYQAARALIKNAPLIEKQIDSLNLFNINLIKIHQLKQYMSEKCKYREQTIQKHYLQIPSQLPKKEKIKLQLKSGVPQDLIHGEPQAIEALQVKIKLNLK